jgi:uncharacterized glyoxalase superfamily protein PhnB
MKDQADLTRLMQGVIPYLAVDGAEKAVEFYTRAFGGKLYGDIVKDDSGKVMNACVEINGGMVMLMDIMPNMGDEGMRATSQGLTLQIITYEGDLWWNRAVEAGCIVTQTFKPEFWGDRYGRLQDPFGLSWAINEPGAGK